MKRYCNSLLSKNRHVYNRAIGAV